MHLGMLFTTAQVRRHEAGDWLSLGCLLFVVGGLRMQIGDDAPPTAF